MATESTEKPLRGKELLRQVVNQILTHPNEWNQKAWHCGTSHCVGGWCQVLAKAPLTESKDEMRELAELTEADADYLFAASRNISDIHCFVKTILDGKKPFNRDGFNRDGFDRDGFDRDGFDRDGFNRDGFNRAGFNRAGFNRAGFNRDGVKLELL